MRQGSKRHVITIQRLGSGLDSHGQPNGSWTDVGTYFANVVYLSGRELELARQREANASYRIECYYVASVTPKDRVVYGGRTLQIASVEDVGGRQKEMVLLCGETVST